MSQPTGGGIERRRHERVDLVAQVRVSRGQGDIIMELSNISASGAMMHMGMLKRPSWVAMERVIDVSITHPVDLDTVELKARIMRIVEDRSGISLGVCFEDVSPEAHAAIARLLRAGSVRPAPPPLPRG